MAVRSLRLLALLVLFVPLAGCSHTWGAPEGPDEISTESAAEAMEEEEGEDAWRDANR